MAKSLIEGNFEIRTQTGRVKLFYKSKYVTAFNDCNWRPYIYPFCSPGGSCMLHESSVDHPFHNGIFFGHRLINIHEGSNPVDFWVPLYSPLHSFCSGRIICRQRTWEITAENSICFHEQSQWLDQLANPVLIQQSDYDIQCGDSVNSMGIRTTLTSCRDITLAQKKEGFLGVRIADTYCPNNGGKLIDSAGHLGEKDIFDTTSDWVDFQGRLGGETFGLLVHQPVGREPIPWFIRNYGIVTFNDFRNAALELTKGQEYKLSTLIAAHDSDHTNPELTKIVNAYCTNNR